MRTAHVAGASASAHQYGRSGRLPQQMAVRAALVAASTLVGAGLFAIASAPPAQANYPGPPPGLEDRSGVLPFGAYEDAPPTCPTAVPKGTVLTATPFTEICDRAVRTAPTPEAAAAIRYAFSKLGSPYSQSQRYSISPPIFDCSSFIARAYDAADAAIVKSGVSKNWFRPDYLLGFTGAYMPATYQGSNLQRLGSINQLQPGDVLIQFDGSTPANSAGNAGHAQMWLGDGLVIQSGGDHPTSLVNVSRHANSFSNEWYFRYGSTPAIAPIFTKWTALGGSTGLPGPALDATESAGGDALLRRYERAWIYWSPRTGANEVHGAILWRYLQMGRQAGPLGLPVSDEQPAGVGAGVRMSSFERGRIYHVPNAGTYEVFGAIGEKYVGLGADSSWLGVPVGVEQPGPFTGAVSQRFAGGTIYHSVTGTFGVGGAMDSRYRAAGVATAVGLPVSDRRASALPDSMEQDFERGRLYWSEATGAFEVYGAIHDRYRAIGGPASLGLPVSPEQPGGTPGSRKQEFTGGTIFWSAGTGAFEVRKPIKVRYDALGAAASPLGLPVGPARAVAGGATLQIFAQGAIVAFPDGRIVEVRGAIWQRYAELGMQQSPIGLPVSNERAGAVAGTRVQDFQGGRMYWSSTTGAHQVYGAILAAYLAGGGESSSLGLPTSGETAGPVAGARQVTFQRGVILWSPATGTRVVTGAFATSYVRDSLGAQIGLPVGPDRAGVVAGVRVQDFQYGRMFYSAATGAHALKGAILDRYLAMGGEKSAAGLPTSSETDGQVPGARRTTFANGTIYWSGATGARDVLGAMHTRYLAIGGPASALGLPSASAVAVPGAMAQQFTGGSMYLVGSRAFEISGEIWARYRALGAHSSIVGLPASTPRAGKVPGSTVQDFATGALYSSAETGTREVYGAILTRYRALGAEGSALGLPTTGEVAGPMPGSRAVYFVGGAIYWSPATGAQEVYGAIGGLYRAANLAPVIGLPTTGERAGAIPGSRLNLFTHGRIYWSAATGAHEVHGAILGRYLALGAEKSGLGLPTTSEYVTPTGRANDFVGGRISWDSRTGVVSVVTK